jgi:hypothetical protein
MAELADATDLKSVDFINREGSSPSIPKAYYQLADFYYKEDCESRPEKGGKSLHSYFYRSCFLSKLVQ